MRNLFKIIFDRDNIEFIGPGSKTSSVTTIISLFFAGVSAVLTALNVINGYKFMAVTTATLIVGFILAAVFAKTGRTHAARIVIAVLCAMIFSVYAAIGGNYGFAILWILLIPVVGYMLVGLKVGFLLSLYFQVFLIILFYTPLSAYVTDYYTAIFIIRFPLLYCASFISVTIMMCQRQKFYNELHRQAYLDAMTGLFNRRRFIEIENATEKHVAGKVSVLSLDLNRLKYFNDKIGHEAGDEMILETSRLLKDAFPKDDCFRVGGDEFMVISGRASSDIRRSIEDFQTSVKEWKGLLVPDLSVSVGCAFADEHPKADFSTLCRLADQEMYIEKAHFYENTEYERRSSELS